MTTGIWCDFSTHLMWPSQGSKQCHARCGEGTTRTLVCSTTRHSLSGRREVRLGGTVHIHGEIHFSGGVTFWGETNTFHGFPMFEWEHRHHLAVTCARHNQKIQQQHKALQLHRPLLQRQGGNETSCCQDVKTKNEEAAAYAKAAKKRKQLLWQDGRLTTRQTSASAPKAWLKNIWLHPAHHCITLWFARTDETGTYFKILGESRLNAF